MKHCPQCRETYADESLNYCLNDGTPLSLGVGPDPRTEILSADSPDRPTIPIIPQQTYDVPQNAAYAPAQAQGKGTRAWIWVLGILGLVVLLCGGGFAGLIYLGSQSRTANVASFSTPAKGSPTPLFTLDDNADTPTPTPSTPGEKLTMAQYEKITIGMPRAEVEKMMGSKGSEITSSSGGGINIAVIQWEGENYKSIIITFENDKVFTRSQVGLK